MADPGALEGLDVEAVADPVAQQLIRTVLALIEQLAAENTALRAETQRLEDEIARLTGRPPKPTIRPQAQSRPPPAADLSSQAQRREPPQPWHKAAKLPALAITRTERLRVDPATLPADAVCKDLERVVVQDLVLQVETVCFETKVWYSPRQGKSYRASVPPGYEGAFGTGRKTLALALHMGANVPEAKLHELFGQLGVSASADWLSGWLSEDQPGSARRRRRWNGPGWRAARGSIWTTRRRGWTGRTNTARCWATGCSPPTTPRPGRIV